MVHRHGFPQLNKLEVCWFLCLKSMVKGELVRKETPEDADEVGHSFIYTNEEVQRIMKTMSLGDFIYSQYLKYISQVSRTENTALTKKILFTKSCKRFYRDPWLKISELLGVSVDQTKQLTQSRSDFFELVHQRLSSSP